MIDQTGDCRGDATVKLWNCVKNVDIDGGGETKKFFFSRGLQTKTYLQSISTLIANKNNYYNYYHISRFVRHFHTHREREAEKFQPWILPPIVVSPST